MGCFPHWRQNLKGVRFRNVRDEVLKHSGLTPNASLKEQKRKWGLFTKGSKGWDISASVVLMRSSRIPKSSDIFDTFYICVLVPLPSFLFLVYSFLMRTKVEVFTTASAFTIPLCFKSKFSVYCTTINFSCACIAEYILGQHLTWCRQPQISTELSGKHTVPL